MGGLTFVNQHSVVCCYVGGVDDGVTRRPNRIGCVTKARQPQAPWEATGTRMERSGRRGCARHKGELRLTRYVSALRHVSSLFSSSLSPIIALDEMDGQAMAVTRELLLLLIIIQQFLSLFVSNCFCPPTLYGI